MKKIRTIKKIKRNRNSTLKIFSILLLVIMLPQLIGCGKKEISLDIDQMALEISQSEYFSEDFFKVESNIISQMYGIETEDVKIAGYASSGGLADELTIFEATNDDDAKMIYELATEHIADSKEGYQSYKPDEVYKLEHAILIEQGKYVIVCVNGSYDEVDTLIKAYLK